VIKAVVAVVAALVVAGVVMALVANSGGSSTSSSSSTTALSKREVVARDSARAWEKQVLEAYTPMVSEAPDLIRHARDWSAGTLTDEQFGGEAQRDVGDFATARDRLLAIAPYAKAPLALGYYQRAAELYIEFARVYAVATGGVGGDLRMQLELLARRVRELGDRVYDRATEAMAPYVRDDPAADPDVRLPEEVPIWTAEGLAVGPPLDAPPPPAAAEPPMRARTRPTQPAAAWTAAVAGAGVPATGDVDSAIDGGDAARLGEVATRLLGAAESLRPVPDPAGGREKSAVARLALLVDADAARAAQAGALAGGDAARRLADTGRRLDLIASGLWPTDLGARRSAFDPALLAGAAP
jgi:hypothetical protein